MKFKKIIALLLLFIIFPMTILSHSGRTDSHGGHNSSSGYHYHHGMGPHQHPNGICPYDSSYESSTSKSTTNTKKDDNSTVYAYRNIVYKNSNIISTSNKAVSDKLSFFDWLSIGFVIIVFVLPIICSIYESIYDYIKNSNTETHTQLLNQPSQNTKNIETKPHVQHFYCPKCGGLLKLKNGKYGKFIGCSNYPKCKYTKSLKRTKD